MLKYEMYRLAKELFPICRSITGNGVRETFRILKREFPKLMTYEVPSGTSCFDWKIPNEWNIRDAYIKDLSGRKIIDFQKSNLHILQYSEPVHQVISLEELNKHLYSIPEMPDAIPYKTSYYQQRWGFCLEDRERKKLSDEKYEVYIDSALTPGFLTYGEIIFPGDFEEEIFLSTNICHPSMANNELSGPIVSLFLAKWISELKNRRYTYRIVFIPETIGSIFYLSKHYVELKKKVIAGFNVVCVGDDNTYSYLPSRNGNTISDRVAKHVLSHIDINYKTYSYLERGSDERQYCAPGIDLPIASVMRSKYAAYSEYHTSLDDLNFISPDGLWGGYNAIKKCLEIFESNVTCKNLVLAEPHLAKYNLYSTLGASREGQRIMLEGVEVKPRDILNILAYCDGRTDLFSIANLVNLPYWKAHFLVAKLVDVNLLEEVLNRENVFP